MGQACAKSSQYLTWTGAFYGELSDVLGSRGEGFNTSNHYIERFDASRSNSIYKLSATVQPPSAQVLIIIKI